jgi:hypothetical protein
MTIAAESVVVAKEKKNSSLFPVLVVLFLISYGLLTLLVVEQDKTIGAQRTLISQLYGDSVELTAMKSKEIQREHADARAMAHSKAQTQAVPPSSQEKPQAKMQSDSGKVRRQLLQKPKGVEDNPDVRRMVGKV